MIKRPDEALKLRHSKWNGRCCWHTEERVSSVFGIVDCFKEALHGQMLPGVFRLNTLKRSLYREAHFPEPFFIIGFGCGFFAVPASLGLMKLPGFVGGAGCTPPPVASK
jgi:hypothetical protein